MHDQMELPQYQCHKKVRALQIEVIETIEGNNDEYRLHFVDHGYDPLIRSGMMFSRYMPLPGDFLVVYDDGYESISPKKAFEEGYTGI
jgi:hypothetical protein